MTESQIIFNLELSNTCLCNHPPKSVPSMRFKNTLVVFFLLVGIFGFRPYALGLEFQEIRVGINGYYKNGFWTPITVRWDEAEATSELRLEVLASDSDGTPTRTQLDLPASSGGQTATVYAKLGIANAGITIRMLSRGPSTEVLAERQLKPQFSEIRGSTRKSARPNEQGVLFLSPVSPERPLFLVFGDSDPGLQEMISLLRLKDNRRPIVVLVDSPENLPADPLGYDAFEFMLITTSNPALFETIPAHDPRIEAVSRWLSLGGSLLFCPGKNSEPLIAGENALLGRFLPGRFERMTHLRQGAPIELYSGSKRSILMDGSEIAPFLEIPFLSGVKEGIEVSEGDLPLVVRQAYGFGMLTYFGGDLNGPPLGDWRDRPQFLLRLLNWSEVKTQTTNINAMSLIHLGYNDFSGQLRSALDHFENVKNTPFSLILLLIVVYVLAIGPLDWLVVHKILKKPRLTWVTFPLEILLFCWIAFAFAAHNRSQPLSLNKADLFDIDVQTGLTRVSTWGEIFSPKDAVYDIALRPRTGSESLAVATDQIDFHWLGLTGSGLGGMNPQRVSSSFWENPYSFSSGKSGELVSVPIRVRSTKSFFGQWNLDRNGSAEGSAAPESGEAATDKRLFAGANLSSVEGIPSGTLTNDLPVPINDALLVYGHWVLKLGRLEPGQSVTVGTQTLRRELWTILKSSKAGFDEHRQPYSTRQLMSYDSVYNPQSRDVWPILRTMSFFQSFGGFETIGLHNTLHANLDWSNLLLAKRAVLIGSLDSSDTVLNSRLLINDGGQDVSLPGNHTAVVRVAIPVKK